MSDTDISPWLRSVDAMKQRARNTAPLLNKLVDEVVLPALARNYRQSGLKVHGGKLLAGVSQRGGPGNYVKIGQTSATVGISYAQVPYARWAIEGRGPVKAKNARALRFEIEGEVIFRKSVKAAPPHRIYFLTSADLAKAKEVAARFVREGK